MKRRLIGAWLTVLLSLLLASFSGCKKEYTAPNFTVLNDKLKEVELEDFIGKPIVLNFWATWCYYCTLEMPDFEAAYEAHGDDVVFLMVNATDGRNETVAKAKAYIDEMGYGFPVYYDTALEAVNAYDITGFPSTFFIDKNGDVVTSKVGMISAEALEEGIKLIK